MDGQTPLIILLAVVLIDHLLVEQERQLGDWFVDIVRYAFAFGNLGGVPLLFFSVGPLVGSLLVADFSQHSDGFFFCEGLSAVGHAGGYS